MSFKSLDHILNSVQQQPGWETFRQYCHVLQCWTKVVTPQIAAHSRPLYINRQVLWVATSSSAWAQNLSLQRFSVLKKLNSLLPTPLSDIRFSSASWYNQSPQSENHRQTNPAQQHPSFVGVTDGASQRDDFPLSNDPQEVFQHWREKWQQFTQSLPLCPQCQCPTPPGELQRWVVCAYCRSQPKNPELNYP